MNKKSLVGIGIAIAIAILVILSTTMTQNTSHTAPSNTTSGGPSTLPTANTSIPAPTVAKKSYTVELNESVGIAAK